MAKWQFQKAKDIKPNIHGAAFYYCPYIPTTISEGKKWLNGSFKKLKT